MAVSDNDRLIKVGAALVVKIRFLHSHRREQILQLVDAKREVSTCEFTTLVRCTHVGRLSLVVTNQE